MSNINDKATVELFVNGERAEQTMTKLRKRAEELNISLQKAQAAGDGKGAKKFQKELDKVNKELNRTESAAKGVGIVLNDLSGATLTGLNKALRHLKNELAATKPNTDEWERYAEQIASVKERIKELNEATEPSKNVFTRFRDWGYKSWGAIDLTKQAIGGAKEAITGYVEAYADMDSAMANAQKFTGMTREEVEQLNEEFKKMDTRTSREGLNELAAAAGRLGKNSVEDVMGFVRAGDVIGVAMDELGADAPQIISQLAGIFNLDAEMGTEKAMLAVGSAINTLSQNCAASAPNLVDFSARLGAVANSTNMSMQEMLAFGALLDDQKVSIEKSSTAIQGVITKMYAAPAEFAPKAGLDVQAFTDALNRSSTEGIMMFVEALSQMDQMEQAATLKALGTAGAGVTQTFQTLAGNVDLLKQRMQDSNTAFAEAASATEEFNVQNNTVQAKLEKSAKASRDLSAELGEQLLPLFNALTTATAALARAIMTVINFMIEHKGAVLTVTAAVVAYSVAVNLATIKTKLFAAAQAVAKGATIAWRSVLLLGASAASLLTGNITRATAAFNLFSKTIKKNPLGLLVSVVTAAVGALVSFVSSSSDAENATERLAEAQKRFASLEKEAEASCAAEITKLDALYKATQDQTLAMEDRVAAVKKLQEQYPEYFGKLSQEAILAGNAADTYERLCKNIVKSAKAQARRNLLIENETELVRLREERRRKVTEMMESGGTLFRYSDIDRWETEDYKNGLTATNPDPNSKISLEYNNPDVLATAKEYNKQIAELEYQNRRLAAVVSSDVVSDLRTGSTFNATTDARFSEENRWRTMQEDVAKASYRNQEVDYEEHQKKMKEIAAEYNEKLLKRNDLTDSERETILDEYHKNKKTVPTTTYTPIDRRTPKQKEAEAKREAAKAKKEFKASLDAYKAARLAADTEAIYQYKSGEIDYAQLLEKRYKNESDYYANSIKLFETTFADREATYLDEDKDYQTLLQNKAKADEEYNKERIAREVDAINRRQQIAELQAQSEYGSKEDPTIADEIALQAKLYAIREQALKEQQALYVVGSKEYADIQYKIEELTEEKILKQKELHVKAVNNLRKEYDKKSAAERFKLEKSVLDALLKAEILTAEQYEQYLKGLTQKYESELPGSTNPNDKSSWSDAAQKKYDADLKLLQDALNQELISQEDYNRRVANLDAERRNKMSEGLKNSGSEWVAMLTNMGVSVTNLLDTIQTGNGSLLGNISSCVEAVSAIVGGAMQIATQWAEAESAIQTAAIEKRYEREIELAQGNSYKVAKLEKKKEKEIAKVKNDAAKKQFAMQVIAAVAQTAIAGLNAYSSAAAIPLIGHILAPIALAVAVAQGMVQVALLKKQQQAAEAQGYSEGGFTKPGAVDEPAGIVHAGEWVASQRLLANPVARPMIEALDYAQRTNTIGSLRAADVSRSIRANDTLTRIAEGDNGSALMVAAAMQMSRAASEMTNRLNEPFVTVNTVTGDHGIKRAQDEYTRLMNNKSPKSRRNAANY